MTSDGIDKRASIRESFPSLRLHIPMGAKKLPLLDISLGGVAFLSPDPIAQGLQIAVSPKAFRAIEVVVLRCQKIPEPQADGFRFRISARFTRGLDKTLLRRVVETLKDDSQPS
ncbi:MAG: hypothetical protein OEW12_06475 [Deltaproteobacteria bacterium]|nr:hypothetical protein [Deltaproteobacteria bacterium]